MTKCLSDDVKVIRRKIAGTCLLHFQSHHPVRNNNLIFFWLLFIAIAFRVDIGIITRSFGNDFILHFIHQSAHAAKHGSRSFLFPVTAFQCRIEGCLQKSISSQLNLVWFRPHSSIFRRGIPCGVRGFLLRT